MPKTPEGAPQTVAVEAEESIRIQRHLIEVWAKENGYEAMDWTEGEQSMADKFEQFLSESENAQRVRETDLNDHEAVNDILQDIEQVELKKDA